MSQKSRQPAKPPFVALDPTLSSFKRSAGSTQPNLFPFALADILTENTGWIHDCCANATRPTGTEIEAIKVGDLIKVGFEGPEGRERMWVKVAARDGDKLHGKLQNTPLLFTRLHWGDRVEFSTNNIVGIKP